MDILRVTSIKVLSMITIVDGAITAHAIYQTVILANLTISSWMCTEKKGVWYIKSSATIFSFNSIKISYFLILTNEISPQFLLCSWVSITLLGTFRHRWTGRYEAHLWDNSCRKEGQTRKGRQGDQLTDKTNNPLLCIFPSTYMMSLRIFPVF